MKVHSTDYLAAPDTTHPPEGSKDVYKLYKYFLFFLKQSPATVDKDGCDA
jgi:hypothetical protein